MLPSATAIANALKSNTVRAGILGAIVNLAVLTTNLAPAGSKPFAAASLVLSIATIITRINAKQPLGPVIDDVIAKTVDAVHQLQAEQPTMKGEIRPAPVPLSMVNALVKAANRA